MITTGMSISTNGTRSQLSDMIDLGPSGDRSPQYLGQNKTCVHVGCVNPCIWKCTDGKCMDCYARNRMGDFSPAVNRNRKRARLTEEQVRTIRVEHAKAPETHLLVWAERYGVDRNTIRDVVEGRSWKWVTTERRAHHKAKVSQ